MCLRGYVGAGGFEMIPGRNAVELGFLNGGGVHECSGQ